MGSLAGLEWPGVQANEGWLLGVLRLAEEEAGELLASAVDVEHLVLAFTREEAGGIALMAEVGLDARRMRDFVVYIAGVNEARSAAWRSRPYRRTAKNQATVRAPSHITTGATRLVEDALTEAAANGSSVGPAHFLVALCHFGGAPGFFEVTAGAVRAATGLSGRPAPFAHVTELRSSGRRPLAVGPLVLGGGGEEVLAEVFARLSRPAPRLVYVAAASPEHPNDPAVQAQADRAGGVLIERGLTNRDDAHDHEVCDELRRADAVYLAGGRAEALVYALAGTPAMEALMDASDAGAVVIGSSAGATVLGAATVSPHLSDQRVGRLDVFGWLPDYFIRPHWVGRTDDDRRVAGLVQSLLPGLRELRIPQMGAVWVDPGWTELSVLHPGEHGSSAQVITWPDGATRTLPPASPLD